MATWEYEVMCSSGGISRSSPMSATIKRKTPSEAVDTAIYTLGSTTGTCSSTNTVQVNASGVEVTFGGYGKITPSRNTSTHALSGQGVSGIPESILNIGTSGTSISITEYHSGGTGNGIYLTDPTTFTISVTVNPKYSASTISAGDVSFGSTSTVTIANAKLSELNHSVTWSVSGSASHSNTASVSTGVSTSSYLIPDAWMDSVPNSTSIACTITLTTKHGNTTIGTSSKNITLSVPANIKPTIGSLTATVINPVTGFSGQYIQNKTGAKIKINGLTAGTGASIQASGLEFSMTQAESYSFSSANMEYSVGTIPSGGSSPVLKNSGSITFTVVATDSRGRRSNPANVTISIVAYSPPTATSATAYRCNASGVADENGTYACIRVVADFTSMTGNTLTINSKYYQVESSQTPAQNNMVSGTPYIIGNGALSPANTYYIRFILTDNISGAVNVDVLVQTASYSIHVKNGGDGVAFGKTSEQSNAVEINPGWDLYYKGDKMFKFVYSSTTLPSSGLFQGLVCLLKKT